MAAVEGVLSALERNWEMVDATLAGMDDAILARRPTDQCNSIAWLLWHMTRVVDTFVHTRLQAQPQVWIRDGWYAKFGMDPDPDNRGVGWTRYPSGAVGSTRERCPSGLLRGNQTGYPRLPGHPERYRPGSAARYPACARAAHRGCRLGTDDLGQRGARWSNRVPAGSVSGHGLVRPLVPSLPRPPGEGFSGE